MEFRASADTAYRIIEANGDVNYVVEALEPGAEPMQVAAFKSHADAEAWIIMKALKVVGRRDA